MSDAHLSTTSPRIAVIGGGISGLTAAYRLSRLLPGAKLELFEASDRLGGVLHTERNEDHLLELGADSFIDKLPAAVELCHELGLANHIIPTNEEPRRALILFGGKLYPVPSGFVQMRPERIVPMLCSPLLSWRGKLRLLAERWIPKTSAINSSDYDESLSSFATRRLGREAFERLVQPLLAGIYTADPTKLSVAATMAAAIEAERKHGSLRATVLASRADKKKVSTASGARYGSFVTLRGGLIELVKALTDQLSNATLHLSTSIQSVSRAADHRWSVLLRSDADPELFDGVILALPAPRASELLASENRELADDLGSIPYASSAVAGLVYRRQQISDPLDGFGIVVPAVEGRQIVAASFSSVKFPGRAPLDQVLVRVFIGGALQPELLERSDAELLELAQKELTKILGISGDPIKCDLVRWNEKMPQYHVGHVQLVDRIEQQISTHRGLELAGNAYRGVGIPQCVQSGDEAARRLCADLSSAVEEVTNDSA